MNFYDKHKYFNSCSGYILHKGLVHAPRYKIKQLKSQLSSDLNRHQNPLKSTLVISICSYVLEFVSLAPSFLQTGYQLC